MPGYKRLIFLYTLASCIFLCLPDTQVCYPPNRPIGGNYTPHKGTYQVGDIVIYSCSKGYFPVTLTSNDDPYSECQNSGAWSPVQDTFCDGPSLALNSTLIKRGRITPQETTTEDNKIKDGILGSCHSSSYEDKITWHFNINRKMLISAVRIYGPTGERYRLEVIVRDGSNFGWNQKSCGLEDTIMGRNRHILYRCPEGTTGDNVFIKDWLRENHFLKICEVEIFTKTESSCGPPDVSIPNGYLEYERASAYLTCDSGYKRTSTQKILCKQSSWLTNGHFCVPVEGSLEESERFVVIILSSVLGTIVLLVIIVTIIILLCRRRRNSGRTPSGSIMNNRSYFSDLRQSSRESEMGNSRRVATDEDPEEHEYSTVRYSNFIGRVELPLKVPTYVNYPR